MRVWMLIFALLMMSLQPAYGIIYELRNGSIEVKPGTYSDPQVNIYVDDLVKILLMQEQKVNDLESELRSQKKEVLILKQDLKELNHKLDVLQRHYFRQF